MFYRLIAVAMLVMVVLNVILVYRLETNDKSYSTPIRISSQDGSSNLNMKVSGTGRVYTNPDIVLITIGVSVQSKNAQDAQEENAEKMNNVMDAIEKNGISETNIKTKSYRLEPVIRYEDRTNIIVGYVAENRIQVTLENIEEAGKIIDTSIFAGANEINYIQFSLSDDLKNELREQAMDLAVQDAKQRAKTISKSIGVELMEPIEINLIPTYEPIPMVYEAKVAGTPIAPGELEVLATVEVTYLFK